MGKWVNASNHAEVDPATVRRLRRELFLTQQELAMKAGCSFDTIRDFEGTGHGREHGFRLDSVRRLAAALLVEPHDLLPVAKPLAVVQDHDRPSASTA